MDDRDALVAAAQALARRLGRATITQAEFNRLSGLPGDPFARARRRFGGWDAFCRAAGLMPRGPGGRLPDAAIFAAMRDALLACGGVGTFDDFAAHFRLGRNLLATRGWTWPEALWRLRKWATKNDPAFPYLDQLPAAPPSRAAARGHALGVRVRGRPVFGDPLNFRGFVRAPTNEQGVAMLFAVLAPDLGFAIEATQQAFPDCYALRRIGEGLWQRVRIEFEFRAKNFAGHGHDPKRCDLIVCWEDDWGAAAPIPVIELKSRIRALMAQG
jgi:hypothetical protein